MALISKNGQISELPAGRRKGIVSINGQISPLIPIKGTSTVVVAEPSEGYGHAVMGVAAGSISTVMGVATANISKVNGV